jgi:NAD(P)-dependent dehydrogenase (short-subunit alcohol dehydrogenase family)
MGKRVPRFDGRVAVVSGASSGLGRRLALDLEAHGASVVAVARREPELQQLGLPYEVCDVAEEGAWAKLLGSIEDAHGRLDILINSAGIERRRGVDDVTVDDVRTTMAVNFDATVAGTLAVLPGMLSRGNGVICNISSDHGRAPGPGTPAYCASKAAVSAFTESLAHEVADRGVRLHVLYPGWVPTALGQGAVDQGMKKPPRAVHRTEEQISSLTLRRLGSDRIEINAARLATLAPVVRAIAPRMYSAGMRRAAQSHEK